MAIRRIDSYLDIPKLEGEHEQFSKFLIDDYESIVKLFNAISKAKGGSSSMAEAAKNAKELGDAIKQTAKSSDALEKQKQRLIELEKKEAVEIANVKQQIADRNKYLKIQAENENAATGSIEASKARIKDLTNQRNLLNVSTEAGQKKLAELNSKIDQENEFIRQNVSLLEQQKINIGNYAGSFQKAFSVLETELSKIREQLANTGKDSKGFDELNKKATLIEKVMEGLSKNFTSTRQELRALTEASKTLGTTFGITSSQFQSFVQEVGERKDQLDDIQKTINFQSSDTKYLDGIINGVQGVVGAYGAWQAAAVLVGQDNEELQKTMVKLQAVLTLVTSIQAVANSLQAESGTIQTIVAGKAALLTAAEQLKAYVFGEATAAVIAETAATEANVIANAENAVAMEASAASAAVLETGMTGAAVAEGAAAAGAVSLSTALIATGIGALVIGLVVGIVALVDSISDWVHADEIAIKTNQALTDSLTELINKQKELDQLRRYSTQQELEDIERINAKRKASGVNPLESLALDKYAAQKRHEFAEQDVKDKKITLDRVNELQAAYENAATETINIEDQKASYLKKVQREGKKVDDDRIKGFDDAIKYRQGQESKQKALYERDLGIYKESVDAKQALDLISNQEAKMNADDQRKYILESTRLEADYQISNNERVLNNERSTLAQRLAALQSNSDERKKILNAENNAVQSDPTVSDTDKKLSAQKTAREIQQVENEANDNRLKEIKSFNLRRIAAETSINNLRLERSSRVNKDLADNDILSYNDRLDAEKDYLEAKQQISDANYKKQLADAGLNQEEIAKVIADPSYRVSADETINKEIELITAQHYAEKENIVLEGEQSITAILESEFKKQVDLSKESYEQIQSGFEGQFLSASKAYSIDLITLNNQLLNKKISIEKYNRERKKLEENSTKEQTRILVDQLKTQLSATELSLKQLGDAKGDLDNANNLLLTAQTDEEKKAAAEQVKIAEAKYKRFQDLQKQNNDVSKSLNDALDKQSEESVVKEIKRQQELSDLKKQLAQSVYDLASSLIQASFENELNALAEKQKADDENYTREVENIKNSTLSEQEKANTLAVLDKEKQTRDIQYAQQQKEIKIRQAKFEKAKAISETIFNTAAAIVKIFRDYTFLAGLPLAALMAGIGAAQVATIAARPIPQYAEGTDDHPGGLGVVGEGKHKEIVTTPDGKSFIADRPMLLDLPAHTTVTPLTSDEINQVMHRSLLISMADNMMWMKKESQKDDKIERAINNQTSRLIRALGKNKTVVKNNVRIDNGWGEYLYKNVYR